MATGHVYHWKHGWIPLDHFAALQKAKGNRELAKKYSDKHGLPATFSNRDQAEAALNRSLPAGYSAHYQPARAGAIGAISGYRVTTPNGESSPKLDTPADVRSYVLGHQKRAHSVQATVTPAKKPWSIAEANREFRANQAAQDAKSPRGSVSDAQVALIHKLLIKKIRSGTNDGFMTGPTTRAGILSLSREQASAYINSLSGNY